MNELAPLFSFCLHVSLSLSFSALSFSLSFSPFLFLYLSPHAAERVRVAIGVGVPYVHRSQLFFSLSGDCVNSSGRGVVDYANEVLVESIEGLEGDGHKAFPAALRGR